MPSPTSWSDKQAAALIKAALSLPPAPKSRHVLPEIFTTKCLCGIARTALDFPRYKTSAGVEYVSSVCAHCPTKTVKDQWSKLAIVVCVGCKKELIRMVPRREKSGFEFRSGQHYHVMNCPVCKPGLDRSPFVEQTLFERALYARKT